MDVRQKQRCVIEFLQAEETEPVGIPQCLMNVYRAKAADVSTLKDQPVHANWWVMVNEMHVELDVGTSDVIPVCPVGSTDAHTRARRPCGMSVPSCWTGMRLKVTYS